MVEEKKFDRSWQECTRQRDQTVQRTQRQCVFRNRQAVSAGGPLSLCLGTREVTPGRRREEVWRETYLRLPMH